MTFELHLQFKYHPGDVFTFIGDDDIWVFIDNKLALDLGGTHNEVTGQVMLDTLGLGEGRSTRWPSFGVSATSRARTCASRRA